MPMVSTAPTPGARRAVARRQGLTGCSESAIVSSAGGNDALITLYSYPQLFGVADNNGYGLKVFAFLKLTGVPFVHEHIFDASAAPRGQLPYIVNDGETIGDRETVVAHLICQ